MSSKQYWVFMLNSLCDAVFCSIDTAFGNNISRDVIVALGSFWTIHWVLTQCTSAGIYAYQIWRRHPRNCLILDVFIGLITGTLLIIFHVPVSHIFKLTETQYQMLQQCLLFDGFTLPMEAASRFMMSYITYNCHNKLLIGSNVMTYILLISTDYIAVKLEWGCIGLVATTALTWFVYLIVTVVGCKFWQVKDKVRAGHMVYGAKKAHNLLVYKIVSRIAYAIHGHLASTLGADYAIHTMCIDITSIAEEFRNGLYNCQLVALKASSDKIRTCVQVGKKFYLPSMFIEIAYCLIAVVFMHGKIPLMEVLSFLLLYMVYLLILPLYDCLNAYLVVTDKTRAIAMKSVITCICKILLTMLFLHLGFGLYGLAAALFLETLLATIYYLKNCNWLRYSKEE